MKIKDDILMMYNIVRGLEYTVVGDKKLNRKTFFTKTHPEVVEGIQNKAFDEGTEVIEDFKNNGYTFGHIEKMNIITIANNLDMLYGFFYKTQHTRC